MGDGGFRHTQGSADLGQVAQLDGEAHALPVALRGGRDLALDVAAVGIGGLEEGRLGQNRLVHEADGVVNHDRRVAELLLLTVSLPRRRRRRGRLGVTYACCPAARCRCAGWRARGRG